MQELTNFPPLKLAQLLFLQTLFQASDHSKENSTMKCNSCIFLFKILLKNTLTHNNELSTTRKKTLVSPTSLLFNYTCEIRPQILLLSSSHDF
jgi:hypothetical protein